MVNKKKHLTALEIGLILGLITMLVYFIFLMVLIFVLSHPWQSDSFLHTKLNPVMNDQLKVQNNKEIRKYTRYCEIHCKKIVASSGKLSNLETLINYLPNNVARNIRQSIGSDKLKNKISKLQINEREDKKSLNFLTTWNSTALKNTDEYYIRRNLESVLKRETIESNRIQCPLEDIENPIAFPQVASLLEEIYADEKNELRYVCPVVILTYKWVLANGKCVQPANDDDSNVKGLFVRAASNMWSKGGSLHPVEKIISPEYAAGDDYSTIVALKLQFAMPRLRYIVPTKIPTQTKFQPMQIATSYDWPETDMVSLKQRKKYAPLEIKYMAIYKDRDCLKGAHEPNRNIFCGYEFKTGTKCYHKLGSPLFSDGFLIGMGLDQTCFNGNNATVYYYEDIVTHRAWLRKIISPGRHN